MKKSKKVEIFNPDSKFCSGCGHKNQLVPFMFLGNQRYNHRTGKPIYQYICQNSNCLTGKVEMRDQRKDNCKNHYKDEGGFLDFINPFNIFKKDVCKYCGEQTPSSEGADWY